MNPRVGALLVYNDKIIGEGWHQIYGGNHAEVNAILSVKDRELLSQSTLYVSLEPCNIQRKTPPCTEFIIQHKIPRVVVGCLDPNPEINGLGVAMLRQNGVEVILAKDPTPFIELNKVFFVNQKLKRPYITIKWAETANGFIGSKKGQRIIISGCEAMRYVHYLRSQYHAIMIGKNTALRDDPYLNLRHYYGQNPTRIVLDIDLNLSPDLHLFQSKGRVLVINQTKDEEKGNVTWFVPQNKEAFLNVNIMMHELYERAGIASILVEGGRFLLQQFLNQGIWDEIIVLRSDRIIPEADISAPLLMSNFKFDQIISFKSDTVFIKKNNLHHELY